MSPRTLRSENGNVIVTAMLVMTLLLSLAFTTVATVDGQQQKSRKQRERESSFQLTEGVLGAQIFQLSRRWPGQNTALPYPTECTQTTASTDCPSSTAIKSAFIGTNKDYKTTGPAAQQTTWKVQVRDNADTGAGAQFYSDAAVLGRPTYDANGDQLMWARAQGLVQGKRRTLVALVKAELITLPPIARKTLVAGHFETSNNGNKEIINNGLGSGLNGAVEVRCGNGGAASGTTQPPLNGCAEYDAGKEQVEGGAVYSNPALPDHMLGEEALETLRARAQADGQYYQTGCPPNFGALPGGAVVFIENAACTITSNTQIFSAAKPGVLILARGSFSMLGTSNFFGVIYHANLDNQSGTLVDISGNGITKGGVIVDGPGGVKVGSSANNLMFDPNTFNNIRGYGTAGIVQNTFREIVASS